MPQAFDSSWLRLAIRPDAKRIVPLLIVGDGSAFAKDVQQQLVRLAGEQFGKAIICTDYEKVVEHTKPFFSVGYSSQLLPLQIWEGESVWCVEIVDVKDGKLSDNLSARESAFKDSVRHFNHFAFCKVDCASKIDEVYSSISKQNDKIVFLLSESGELIREANSIAEVVAVYLFTAWRRYCDKADGNLRHAFGLIEDGAVFTLGFGWDAPDIEYFSSVWTAKLRDSVCKKWLEKREVHHNSPYLAREDLLRTVLPAQTYFIDQKDDGARLVFETADEEYFLRYKEDRGTQVFSLRTELSKLKERISRLYKQQELLRGIVLPNATTVIFSRIKSCTTDFEQRLRRFVVLDESPVGLMADLAARLHVSKSYLVNTQEVNVERQELPSLSQDMEKLKRRLEKTPSLSGALMRLGLIVVGLIWLFLGTFVWGRKNVFNSSIMLWMAIAASIITIGLVVYIFLLWYFRQLAVWRAAELARIHTIQRHLCDVGDAIVEAIQDETPQLIQMVDDIEHSRYEVCSRFQSGKAFVEQIHYENRNPRFGENSFDEVMGRRREELCNAIHTAFKAEIEEGAWPNFDAKIWCDNINRHAADAAKKLCKELGYDECTDSAHLTEDDRRRVVHDVVTDARKPAYQMNGDPNSPMWLIASIAWSQFLGDHNTTQVQNISLNRLIAISPMPILTNQ